MVVVYRPSIREVSPPDGWYGMYRPTIMEVSPPDSRYVPANNQGDLPAQWLVCTPAIDLLWLATYLWHWPVWRLKSIRNWFLEIFFSIF
jgi:hypothetical protein